jgi:hypothetical protein
MMAIESRTIVAILATSLVLPVLLALPVRAHHSHGNYEMSDFTRLQGTVKEVHLINPHSWIYLDVAAGDGETTVWALEATNPAGLLRNGIERDDVMPGDLIGVRCHRLKDGSNGCLLGFVTPLHGDPARGAGVEKEWD